MGSAMAGTELNALISWMITRKPEGYLAISGFRSPVTESPSPFGCRRPPLRACVNHPSVTPLPQSIGLDLRNQYRKCRSGSYNRYWAAPAAGTVLGGGTQTLSASFNPTDKTDYVTANGSVSITVNTLTSTTKITSNTPNPAAVGKVVTVDFSVTGTVGVPTGSVTVTASAGQSCSGSLGVIATGSCTLIFTATGTPKLTAAYGGDSNFKSSTSTNVSETVK